MDDTTKGAGSVEGTTSAVQAERERLMRDQRAYLHQESAARAGIERTRLALRRLQARCTHPRGERRREAQLYAESYTWCPDCGAGWD